MKNYTIKSDTRYWPQRNLSKFLDIEEYDVETKSKKKLGKRGSKGIKCPNCP